MWNNEAEAREQIKAMVAEYYHDFKEKKTPYQEGDRITYAARVFDEKEMCALTDATQDFWRRAALPTSSKRNLPSGSALSSPIWSTAAPPPT